MKNEFALYGKDIFGQPKTPESRGPVSDRFVFPPFSILNARKGNWQRRKRAWLKMGIQSEIGRDAKSYEIHDWVDKKAGGPRTVGDGQSIFDPVLCELAYRWWCPEGGQVIDPFAGGSVRGILAASLGYQYWGCDLRAEQIAANKQQAGELLTVEYGPTDLTPVEKHGDMWMKRDDLFLIHGARGGKARTCFHLAQQATKGLTTAGSRKSPQAMLVASMAKALNLSCVIHTPEGDISTGPVADAVKLGAEVIQHNPGRNNVIIARSRSYAQEHGFTEIPFGMTCQAAVEQTWKQVSNLPADAGRIVVPVGSGMSLAGVLWGLKRAELDIPVTGIMVGADPTKRLDEYAPRHWRDMVELIASPHPYDKAVDATLDGVNLDPIYEAKCVPFLQSGDVFWIVGHRDPLDTEGQGPVWVCGDSLDMLPAGPDADFIFSCPPYGDLEKYSDDPKDLSNMDWPAFLDSYKRIIELAVGRLRPNRFACFVVGDFRDKRGFFRNFVSETIDGFRAAGAELWNEAILTTSVGTACLRVTKQFQVSRKLAKTHQNVLVFYKGDPKAIREVFGPLGDTL